MSGTSVREIVFALEFRGHAAPVPGAEGKRRANTVAAMTGSEVACLESEVERLDDATFLESGRITYGDAGSVTFITVERGVTAPGPTSGSRHGAVMWKITGGDGRFKDAQGFITSSFSVTADGEVVDHHVARIMLP